MCYNCAWHCVVLECIILTPGCPKDTNDTLGAFSKLKKVSKRDISELRKCFKKTFQNDHFGGSKNISKRFQNESFLWVFKKLNLAVWIPALGAYWLKTFIVSPSDLLFLGSYKQQNAVGSSLGVEVCRVVGHPLGTYLGNVSNRFGM